VTYYVGLLLGFDVGTARQGKIIASVPVKGGCDLLSFGADLYFEVGIFFNACRLWLVYLVCAAANITALARIKTPTFRRGIARIGIHNGQTMLCGRCEWKRFSTLQERLRRTLVCHGFGLLCTLLWPSNQTGSGAWSLPKYASAMSVN